MGQVDSLTYLWVGCTEPSESRWSWSAPGWCRSEISVRLGRGDACWERASEIMLTWGVKTRSGFTVAPDAAGMTSAVEGADYTVRARIGPLVVTEPVRVVSVVDTDQRRGFAYGTRMGHPVSGEEAFVVHRDSHDDVYLTVRSITAAAPQGWWRPLFPVLLLAQRIYRRRYLRSLDEHTG